MDSVQPRTGTRSNVLYETLFAYLDVGHFGLIALICTWFKTGVRLSIVSDRQNTSCERYLIHSCARSEVSTRSCGNRRLKDWFLLVRDCKYDCVKSHGHNSSTRINGFERKGSTHEVLVHSFEGQLLITDDLILWIDRNKITVRMIVILLMLQYLCTSLHLRFA